jgi:hypothetical protein
MAMNDIENNQGQTSQDWSTAHETTGNAGVSGGIDAQPTGIGNKPANMVSSLVGQVKDKAAAAVAGQKDGIADQIDEFAKTVHNTGDQFAGKQDWIAGAIERGATELGSLASSLRNNDLSSLLTQVTSLARKQPALFVGASLVAGFAVARIGKIVVADVSHEDLPTMPEVGHGSH